MSDPTPVNGTATNVNTGIAAVGGALVSTVEAMILADQAWLGLPGIKQLWEALFGWISGYFVKAAENGATFAVIDIQTGSEEAGISKALAALIAAEQTGNAQTIQAAIQAYASAQSALVNDNGGAVAT